MKAAEAAFKDSVDVWEGGTDTELGARCEHRGRLRDTRCRGRWPDTAAAQQWMQVSEKRFSKPCDPRPS